MGVIEKRLDVLLDATLEDAFEESLATYAVDDPFSYVTEKLPVDILEFTESSDFLGLKGMIYREVRNILCDIEDDSIREADLILGKGSGKSMVAQAFSCYGVYKALELKKPQATFGLTFNTSIYSINVSISRDQARDVVFKGIDELVGACPYFKDKIVRKSVEDIEFKKSIFMMCGHSNSTAFLGYPTLRAVMDEANYMVDNNNRSVAQQLYTALRGSLKTRFPKDYKILCISSDSTPNSFLRERSKTLKLEIDNYEKVKAGLSQ